MTDRLNDLLTDILSSYRLTARVHAHASYCGDWALNTSGFRRVTFHLLGRGSCWLHLRHATAPIRLHAGDFVMFPHDAWHVLAPTDSLEKAATQASPDDGSATTVMCGYFDFGERGRNPIVEALPEVVLVRAEDTARHADLEQLARLMLTEADSDQIGAQHVLDRLSEALFVMVLRFHIERNTERRGLLAMMADPRLSKALAMAHHDPGRPWTVESLARAAGMSRTAFASRFNELVGEPPMEYLTRQRMRIADRLLRDPKRSVAWVAEQVGYATETAFRRAYKRVQGVGPGAVRRGRASPVDAEAASST